MLFLLYDPDIIANPAPIAATLGVGQCVRGVPARLAAALGPGIGPSGYAVVRERWDGFDVLRAATAAQIAALPAETQSPADIGQANRMTLQGRAALALANNAAYLAIATPTNAQVVAQVKALTRQVNALIRMSISQLDSVSDS